MKNYRHSAPASELNQKEYNFVKDSSEQIDNDNTKESMFAIKKDFNGNNTPKLMKIDENIDSSVSVLLSDDQIDDQIDDDDDVASEYFNDYDDRNDRNNTLTEELNYSYIDYVDFLNMIKINSDNSPHIFLHLINTNKKTIFRGDIFLPILRNRPVSHIKLIQSLHAQLDAICNFKYHDYIFEYCRGKINLIPRNEASNNTNNVENETSFDQRIYKSYLVHFWETTFRLWTHKLLEAIYRCDNNTDIKIIKCIHDIQVKKHIPNPFRYRIREKNSETIPNKNMFSKMKNFLSKTDSFPTRSIASSGWTFICLEVEV